MTDDSRKDLIEFGKYVVSAHLECTCGQHHFFMGVSEEGDWTCESCGRVYQLVRPMVILVDRKGAPANYDPKEDG